MCSPSFLIHCNLCIFYFYDLLCSPPALPSSFLDALHCLPRAVGVPLESALKLVSRMSPSEAHATHFVVLGVMTTCSICNVKTPVPKGLFFFVGYRPDGGPSDEDLDAAPTSEVYDSRDETLYQG